MRTITVNAAQLEKLQELVAGDLTETTKIAKGLRHCARIAHRNGDTEQEKRFITRCREMTATARLLDGIFTILISEPTTSNEEFSGEGFCVEENPFASEEIPF